MSLDDLFSMSEVEDVQPETHGSNQYYRVSLQKPVTVAELTDVSECEAAKSSMQPEDDLTVLLIPDQPNIGVYKSQ